MLLLSELTTKLTAERSGTSGARRNGPESVGASGDERQTRWRRGARDGRLLASAYTDATSCGAAAATRLLAAAREGRGLEGAAEGRGLRRVGCGVRAEEGDAPPEAAVGVRAGEQLHLNGLRLVAQVAGGRV